MCWPCGNFLRQLFSRNRETLQFGLSSLEKIWIVSCWNLWWLRFHSQNTPPLVLMQESSLVVPKPVTITVTAWRFPCPKTLFAKYSSPSSLNSTSLSFSENRQNKDTQRASLPFAAPFHNSLAAGFNHLWFSHHCCPPDSSRMAHKSLGTFFLAQTSKLFHTSLTKNKTEQNKTQQTNEQKQFQRPKTYEVGFYYNKTPFLGTNYCLCFISYFCHKILWLKNLTERGVVLAHSSENNLQCENINTAGAWSSLSGCTHNQETRRYDCMNINSAHFVHFI